MNYLLWHYYKTPKFIIEVTGNYIYFVGHYFSLKLLLETLFSPWKREIFKKEKPGFNLSEIVGVISFNLISRTIGFIVKVATFITAFIVFLLVLALGIIIFALWLVIPFITLPIYFLTKPKDDKNKKDKFVKSHLLEDASSQDLSEVEKWYERIKEIKQKRNRFWSKENLSQVPGIGKYWAYGYTLSLNPLTFDLAKEVLPIEKFVGRKEQIDALQRALAKEGDRNVLLVGDPGVGRKTIVLGLSTMIDSGKCLDALINRRVLLLDVNRLFTLGESDLQTKLIEILDEAKGAGNIILVIPSFEIFIKTQNASVVEILSQKTGQDIQIIGITDPSSYQKFVLNNPTLSKIFDKIDVSEISEEESLEILENKATDLEEKYNLIINVEALQEIVKEAQNLISDVPFPENTINLLEEAVVYIQAQNKKILLSDDIDNILSEKTKIPIGKLKADEREKLENLEKILHQRLIGQDAAIIKISEALRRKRAGLEIKKGPIGSFLFLGPTGVGKTETAKAIAQSYFGDEEKIIRVDMSEFQEASDIAKLIGDSDNLGILTSSVVKNPFSVVLLDEFEKASQKILNIFLTVFDEGYLTDGQGKKVSFKNTLIIATSNAGSELIRELLQKGEPQETLEKKLLEDLLSEKIFSPELINRFDAVVYYKPLTKEELSKIAGLMIFKLNLKLKGEQGVGIKLSDSSMQKLIEEGFDPVFGARNLQRTIQEKVENIVASEIIKGKAQKGSIVEINL